MVEVFKTNIDDVQQAQELLELIHKTFADYVANFDLDDCDNILRVKCNTGFVDSTPLISLLKEVGFHAEVLPDEVPLLSPLSKHQSI